MVAERNPEIRKAVDTLYELSADDKVRAEYEQRRKAWRDRVSAIEGARQDGREEGRKLGREEGIEIGMKKERQCFLELLNQGLSVDEIKRCL